MSDNEGKTKGVAVRIFYRDGSDVVDVPGVGMVAIDEAGILTLSGTDGVMVAIVAAGQWGTVLRLPDNA